MINGKTGEYINLNDKRRKFLKKLALLGIGAFGSYFVYTSGIIENIIKLPEYIEKRNRPKKVDIKELIESPESYLDKKIEVNGYPEYVGYKTYTFFLPVCSSYGSSYGCIYVPIFEKITTYKLHESPNIGSLWINVLYGSDHDFLPKKPNMISGTPVRVTGIWRRKSNKDYHLDAKRIEKV
jgi:hypothetical protein